MRAEPRGDLARYAFGYSDRKPGRMFWLIHLGMVAFVLWGLLGGPVQAAACHRFSVWKYLQPQRCAITLAANDKPTPPAKPTTEQYQRWFVNKRGDLEVVRTPGMTDEEGRAIAIDALKEVMGRD